MPENGKRRFPVGVYQLGEMSTLGKRNPKPDSENEKNSGPGEQRCDCTSEGILHKKHLAVGV